MYRIFAEKKVENGFFITKEQLHHLKVVRSIDKEFIVVFEQNFYKVKLNNNVAEIIEKVNQNHEFIEEIILAMPLIEWTRFEWAIEKATELGVNKILPFKSEFSNFDIFKFEQKKHRFLKIINSASEQSFRNKKPILLSPINFDKIFSQMKQKSIYLAHSDLNNDLKPVHFIPTNSLLIIGPEGGFSKQEIDFAKQNNANIISLGKTILRSETAAIKMISLIKE